MMIAGVSPCDLPTRTVEPHCANPQSDPGPALPLIVPGPAGKARTACLRWMALPEIQLSLMAGSSLTATLLALFLLKAAGPMKSWLLDAVAAAAILLGRKLPEDL